MSYGMLVAALSGWILAGVLKVPIRFFISHKWEWRLLWDTGGMPSQHSALMAATTLAIGLFAGFDQPTFALAVAVSMVIIYDAAGLRRQAGYHAERINMILNEIFAGHPVSEKQLKEVLGHTPFEVMGGVFTGLVIALVVWLIWPK